MSEPDPRYDLANERTLLAWQRSALGLLATGVAVAHFLEDSPLALVLTGILLLAAAVALLGGQQQHARTRAAIHSGAHVDPGRAGTFLTGLLLVALALAAVYVVWHHV